ncbi:MAG TPA: ABC transporter ATP-binding protein [Candidatus Acidoferrum sp.]|nr:ABC transporter ATP-binding protein [Candidatus Acidoferrum sp.]
MSVVIRAEGVGKRYRLGVHRGGYQTLREALVSAVIRPFSRWRHPETERETLWALRDVSFEISEGEVIGVIGRNGAGKSTLLKILSRITPPTLGRVEIRGRVGALLEIGTGFSPELTGRENVFLNGVILGMARAEVAARLDEIVEFSGVERFIDTPVKHYSSGMRVRLAFAVAAHLQPEILLVDEVLAVGDIEFQRKCIGRMERVARDGRTVLLVSHNLGTVRALCQRALLLEAGRLARLGPAGDVVEEYLASHAVTSADQEIAVADHVGGVHEIRLLRVSLQNGVAGRFVVHWTERIRLGLEFEVLAPVEDVSFGVSLRTPEGVSIFTVHQDDGGAGRWELAPGRYAVDFEVDNTLRPGLYRLHIGADRGRLSMRNVLFVESLHLEVLAFDPDGAVPAATNTGYVNGRSVWRLPRPLPLAEPSPLAGVGLPE